jgi:hypothetical protein
MKIFTIFLFIAFVFAMVEMAAASCALIQDKRFSLSFFVRTLCLGHMLWHPQRKWR